MSIDFVTLAVAGLLATLAMDLASHALTLVRFYEGPVNSVVIGRWAGHMLRGTLTHADIHEARPIAREASLGMLAHYGIGVVLALAYGLLLRETALNNTLPVALTYGFATNALPWFWLFPSCGFGLLGLKGRGLLRSSFVNHMVFGLALYLALA